MTNKKLDILKEHQDKTRNKRKLKRIFTISFSLVAIVFIVLISIYALNFLTGQNAIIKGLHITDNEYFSELTIRTTSGLNFSENYFFVSTAAIEKKFSHWKITKVTVKRTANYTLTIDFDNVDLIAYYSIDKELFLLSGKNRDYAYHNDYFEVVKKLPYLVNFSDEQRNEAVQLLNAINKGILTRISEIEQFANSYNENMLKLTMGDGNQIFISKASIIMLNNYEKIVENLNKLNACIFFDEDTNTAYTQSCQEAN